MIRCLSDARQIIRHLPIQDKLFIDLEQESPDQGQTGQNGSQSLQINSVKSGLFTKVGISDEAKNFPELMAHVTDNLPAAF